MAAENTLPYFNTATILSVKRFLYMSNNTKHNDIQHNNKKRNIMVLNNVILSVVTLSVANRLIMLSVVMGEGKTTYTFSVSVNAFSVEFPLACYQQAGRVWYISGALQRTYTLFYPAPVVMLRAAAPPNDTQNS
jgi:hypothetical protein